MTETEAKELSISDRFREGHHAVARMLASGMTPSMIRHKTGYSQRRLNLLVNDPTFNELIAIYAKRIGEKWEDTVDAYLDLGMSNMIRAETQIAEHIDKSEDTGELLPINILDKISQGRADRFGYSKHTIHEHKHDFAAMMDRAIARSGKANEMKLIEGQVVTNPPGAALPVSHEALGALIPVSAPAPQPLRARSIASVLDPIKRRKIA